MSALNNYVSALFIIMSIPIIMMYMVYWAHTWVRPYTMTCMLFRAHTWVRPYHAILFVLKT